MTGLRRVTSARFSEHLSRWWFITGVKEDLPHLGNASGPAKQMVYYSLAGILGGKEIPDKGNPIAVAQYLPNGCTKYFINEQATHPTNQ